MIVAPSAHSTLRASPYVRYVAGECFLGSEEASTPKHLTAFGGELHHAFGVTRRHASRVCFVRLSLREGPIADGMRARSPKGPDATRLRRVEQLRFAQQSIQRDVTAFGSDTHWCFAPM